ncbi:hypothetical protein GS682_06840 [Nostoc sp. B(2019)]|nr:hypothetical protein [Nostoc sp. B(2019)]
MPLLISNLTDASNILIVLKKNNSVSCTSDRFKAHASRQKYLLLFSHNLPIGHFLNFQMPTRRKPTATIALDSRFG